MSGLSDHKMNIVRSLVGQANDAVVGNLQQALAGAEDDTALAGVRRLVEAEVADRRLRNAILSPVAPLFSADSKSGRQPFPPKILSMLWRALKAEAPDEVAAASRLLGDYQPDQASLEPLDELTARLAEGLRTLEPPGYQDVHDLLEKVRPGGVQDLIACLALGPTVREATMKLPDWIARTTDESAAAARLAYKDAVAIAEDNGPRFFEMLSAQMAQPWMVLRVISAVMDHPTEAYLAGSELSVFAERLLDDIDRNLEHIDRFDLNGGPAAGRKAGAIVDLVTHQISELEGSIELTRDSGWGARIQKHRKSLAGVVEGRLREIEKVVSAALPTHSIRVGRSNRSVPRLTGDPDGRAVDRAVTLLTFAEAIRTSANYGGFAATRAKVVEAIGRASCRERVYACV